MENKLYIKRALISVFNKDALLPILNLLDKYNVEIISSAGSANFIKEQGFKVTEIEDITSYPSILDGRVKTLHPKIFGPLLARKNNENDNKDLQNIGTKHIDLLIVDLYPFEESVKKSLKHDEIIEKIDIGGQSLIRAAAKNYANVLTVASTSQYKKLEMLLTTNGNFSFVNERLGFATEAFEIVKNYDIAIYEYFRNINNPNIKDSIIESTINYIDTNTNKKHLRYGENPHQEASFYSSSNDLIKQISGKELSYNNLLDVDAALNLMAEFNDTTYAVFAIIKHTNVCGIAGCNNLPDAFDKALQSDPISAFGGIFITNKNVDMQIADKINKLFFEVLLAPSFSKEVTSLFKNKKNRTLITYKSLESIGKYQIKNLLNGIAIQKNNNIKPDKNHMLSVTDLSPNGKDYLDLEFALKIVKHLKSNAIAIVKNKMLLGSGVGQTSRVEALKQAIEKAKSFNLDLKDSAMASDGFFPFPDSILISAQARIKTIAQPGGSIKDKEVIKACNDNQIAMVFTNTRYFKH